jgi:ubiquinone/menaquinone biosynthesis C-methylase UbiE
MSNSAQQTYYDQHYNISDNKVWKAWRPNPIFTQNKYLSDFKETFWQEGAQEGILADLETYAPFESVLDIGCSTGDFLIPLSRVSSQTFGVDLVEFQAAWKLMKQDYNIHCQQLNLDYASLPFEDANFSIVTMLMVLEHVFDVHHAVSEIVRVLKPGGLAVIQVPNIAYIKHRIDLGLGRLPCTANVEKRDNKTEWDGQHLHYFTENTLNDLLKQHGLSIQKVKSSGKFPRVRQLKPAFLGGDLIVFAQKSTAFVK